MGSFRRQLIALLAVFPVTAFAEEACKGVNWAAGQPARTAFDELLSALATPGALVVLAAFSLAFWLGNSRALFASAILSAAAAGLVFAIEWGDLNSGDGPAQFARAEGCLGPRWAVVLGFLGLSAVALWQALRRKS